MKEILTPLGRECQEEAKREDRQQDLFFFVAPTEPNDIVESLCEFLDVNHEEKSLFIVDVPSGKIVKFESADAAGNPSKEDVIKFVRDYQNDLLVAKNIRD